MSNTNNASFLESTLNQLEARKEYEKTVADFQAQLKERIENYNYVVRRTLAKFQPEDQIWSLIIPSDSVLTAYMKYNQEYVFESKGQKQFVSAALLRNDPIAVAAYVRKHIRRQQAHNRAVLQYDAQTALVKANRELQAAQKLVEQAQAEMAIIDHRIQKHEARSTKRAERKVVAKA